MGLWCVGFSPLRVEHYKFAILHENYEQNQLKTAHIDIQAYIHVLDLTFI
jgi:molybdate-binding protein